MLMFLSEFTDGKLGDQMMFFTRCAGVSLVRGTQCLAAIGLLTDLPSWCSKLKPSQSNRPSFTGAGVADLIRAERLMEQGVSASEDSMTNCRRAVSLDCDVHSAGGAQSRLLSGIGGLLIRDGSKRSSTAGSEQAAPGLNQAPPAPPPVLPFAAPAARATVGGGRAATAATGPPPVPAAALTSQEKTKKRKATEEMLSKYETLYGDGEWYGCDALVQNLEPLVTDNGLSAAMRKKVGSVLERRFVLLLIGDYQQMGPFDEAGPALRACDSDTYRYVHEYRLAENHRTGGALADIANRIRFRQISQADLDTLLRGRCWAADLSVEDIRALLLRYPTTTLTAVSRQCVRLLNDRATAAIFGDARVDDDKDVWCEIEDLKDSQLISDAKDDELEQAIVTELQAKALQTLLAGMEWGSFEAACLDIKQENAAAIKIQAIRRGKVARAKAAEEAQQRQEETSAASRIQAIQRGKIQRRQAEKQRQDKEEAAAILKIQAVHRGKASRAQGEEKKKQKEVDAANAKKLQAAQTETTEDLMGSMRNTLETGLLDGSLEKVLAGEEPARTSEVPSTGDFRTLPADAWAVLHGRFSEAAQSSEAELRTMMATKLEAALKDGSLETALIKAQGTKPTEQALSMEEQKAKLRNILEVSLDNGSLEKELSRFQKAPSDLNDVRAKMASQLEACLKDGSLEQALASCAAESKDAPAQDNDMEDIRAKMAIQLEASLYDGKLEKALAAVTPKATPSQTLSVEEVRQSASTALLKGMTDGSLEAAITQAKNEKESKFNLNEVRDKIAKQLQASLDDGSLEAALAKVKAKSAASSEPNIDEMREKMAKQLEACLKDGSLETALAQ
ncbi:unnamed protein product, partial [Polarella glacialis]